MKAFSILNQPVQSPKKKTRKCRSALLEGAHEWEFCLIVLGGLVAISMLSLLTILLIGNTVTIAGLLAAASGGFFCGLLLGN